MRSLGIETATRRGSVAIVEDGVLVLRAEHWEPNAHAERILPLIEDLLNRAGWAAKSLDRLGVGIGPGSFVGLRVGIALTEGLSLGLDRPAVGVSSQSAMARAVPRSEASPRLTLLDARRSEVFVALTDAAGRELWPAEAVARSELAEKLGAIDPNSVMVGEVAGELGLPFRWLRGPDLDLPDATWVAVLAAVLDPAAALPVPDYVRGAGATLPSLPPSPFATLNEKA